MRFALYAGLASLVSSVSATALTYRLEANEKACFYTNVEQTNAKVAFYFAVSRPFSIVSFLWLAYLSMVYNWFHQRKLTLFVRVGPIRWFLRC